MKYSDAFVELLLGIRSIESRSPRAIDCVLAELKSFLDRRDKSVFWIVWSFGLLALILPTFGRTPQFFSIVLSGVICVGVAVAARDRRLIVLQIKKLKKMFVVR